VGGAAATPHLVAAQVPRDGLWCGRTSSDGGVTFVVQGSGSRVEGKVWVLGSLGLAPVVEVRVSFAAPIVGGMFASEPGFDAWRSAATGTFDTALTGAGAASWSWNGAFTLCPGRGQESWSATWVSSLAAPVIADLGAELTAPAPSAPAGANIDFGFRMRNAGTDAATCVQFMLATPNVFPYSPDSTVLLPVTGGSYRNNSTWVGTLAPGGLFEGVVRVRSNLFATGELLVTAGGTPLGASDPNGSNDTASARVTLFAEADLRVAVQGPSFFTSGTSLSYQVQLEQKGPSLARNTRVDLVSVPPLTLKGARLEGDYSSQPCAPPCALGDLYPGQTGRVRFDFEAPPGTNPPASFALTASARSDAGDSLPANNESTLTTTLLPDAAQGLLHTVAPCRLLDTRLASPASPSLCSTLELDVTEPSCGVPSSATAVSLNVTTVLPTADGHMSVFPAGFPVPNTSNLNFQGGQIRANNVVVRLPPTHRIALRVGSPSPICTHAVVDVNGYFE
jgi:hypothetical protein